MSKGAVKLIVVVCGFVLGFGAVVTCGWIGVLLVLLSLALCGLLQWNIHRMDF